ncbi:MBL fold metallo-hydrolase RNA specificity domain-containing protein [Flexithrix dorotheae]|uniref:MBL fold metallo-hydrolase RNA specificity domain-containing protein n=1 Tax=Flexithrix dorotheae TaxID=70993 RepID=UPI0003A55AF5|nr:MBL fold metallo-hydrolase [Flexithrix dorotheae]
MDIRVKFLGGAKTVTGSKYLLEIDDYKLLIDCGLFQGLKELRKRNWDNFPIDPAEVDAIILTHAHLDHSGYLPKLFKEGYDGPVFCTTASGELLEILLKDSAKLQEEEANYAKKKGYSKHKDPKPLYDTKDVLKVLPKVKGLDFKEEVKINELITFRFQNAGHILGAAIVEVFIQGENQRKKIVFSGDLGRFNDPILYAPEIIEEADILFVESTYGNRNNPMVNPKQNLADAINAACERNGCVLIPAFAIGRTQTLLMYIKDLYASGEIPEIPVFMDSPMAITATSIYSHHTKYHKIEDDALENNESFIKLSKHLNIVQSHEGSVALNYIQKNAIIISASGMMTGGRVLHHLYNRLPRKNDSLLLVGYQAEGTRGRRIVDGEEEIKIFGQMVKVNCKIEFIDGLSAHADQEELLQWLKGFKKHPKLTFVIHGEEKSAQTLATILHQEFNWNTKVPDYMESVVLFKGI